MLNILKSYMICVVIYHCVEIYHLPSTIDKCNKLVCNLYEKKNDEKTSKKCFLKRLTN